VPRPARVLAVSGVGIAGIILGVAVVAAPRTPASATHVVRDDVVTTTPQQVTPTAVPTEAADDPTRDGSAGAPDRP
jgi:hypothetical protein